MNICWVPIISIFAFICAGAGWVVIEALTWLFGHIKIL